ncbi:phage replication initiation protein, NGO0469 family [Rhizobium leguminosarum]|uniref:phage replication initiation protein, NGO0469 family n=1 Tax=Rhizobium leguminosarum TaxID=384 RepID=UPI001C953D1C|nr:hypothetical protein [Rhizobium leguminosarum]MBY5728509.1 hypothetical protein [Rhizobium leguminosarum]
MVGDNDQPDPIKPFMVSAWLTASFHEEATLRKYMESWRGAPYTEQQISEFETDGFDWSLMLGVPCMVQMGLNKKGKVKIQNITKLQKNIERAASVNQHIVLILDEYDQKAFEWRELNNQPAPATAAKIISTDAPFGDEIPF